MKNWKPLFIENSKIPVWLSKISPIEIWAITLGPIILSREEMNEQTKRHETIHFQQYLELLFIGFIILYFIFWIINAVSLLRIRTAHPLLYVSAILSRIIPILANISSPAAWSNTSLSFLKLSGFNIRTEAGGLINTGFCESRNWLLYKPVRLSI